ncbi:MAG: glycosyltransferase family protein [Pseudomonadota bacterium]
MTACTAIVQARMGSTRLPGKVLKRLGDRSVLAHVITRLKTCQTLDTPIIATTLDAADDAIRDEAERWGARVFRGDALDVLARYHGAAKIFGLEVVVRVTSDCPLIDPAMIDAMMDQFLAALVSPHPLDYLSNSRIRRYPRGLDAEIFSFAALDQAFLAATEPYEHEHVTPYFYLHPELFAIGDFVAFEDHSALRWTLDTEEDLRLLEAIFARLVPPGRSAPLATQEVLDLFAREPALAEINAQVRQKGLNEG